MKYLSDNDFNDNLLENVPDGVNPQSAVNKGQLDQKVTGVNTDRIIVSAAEPTGMGVGDIWVDESEEFGGLAFKNKAGPDDINSGVVAVGTTSEVNVGSSPTYVTAAGNPLVDVVVPASGKLKVTISARIKMNSTAQEGFAGFTLSGANTLAGSDNRAISFMPLVSGAAMTCSYSVLLESLNPGTTTITMVYRTTGSNADISRRRIIAEPIG